jgi:hypothetical protein
MTATWRRSIGPSGRLSWSLSLGFALLLAGCAGDVGPYLGAVDGLALPPSWQVAKTLTRGNGGESGCVQFADPMCPSAIRYYNSAGALPDLYQEARSAGVASGVGSIEDVAPNCDLITNGARCVIIATRDAVQIEFYFFPDGQDVDAIGVAISGLPTVRVIAERP